MILFVVRHGDPIYNPDSLTHKGHMQAEALARRFALHGLDKIYTSPLIRARQTAQPTCDLLGIKPQTLEWTSENLAYRDLSVEETDGSRHWVFSGNPAKFKNDDTINITTEWYNTPAIAKCKTAKEGYERIQKASDEFLETLGYKHEGSVYKIVKPTDERVAVFCHEGFGATWISHLLNIPPHIFWSSFAITHTGVSAFAFENYSEGYTNPRCIALSDTSHIYEDRLPYESITHFGKIQL